MPHREWEFEPHKRTVTAITAPNPRLLSPGSRVLQRPIDFPSISRETPLSACFPRVTAGCRNDAMFPQPMSRPEFRPDDSSLEPTTVLEQHILAGFPPDLALDLVLNELVVRATEATRAGSAALALARGDEMVCRAATGQLAPDLGVPLNTRDGLSGACVQTRQPQLSVDTEFDPRIDPVVSRRLGIRSILIVPVFDAVNKSQLVGILEVFSPSPAAFSHNDQKVLEGFAEECARIRQVAFEISQRKPKAIVPPQFAVMDSVPVSVKTFESTEHRLRRIGGTSAATCASASL